MPSNEPYDLNLNAHSDGVHVRKSNDSLQELLELYLAEFETNGQVDRGAFLARHADLAHELEPHLEGIDLILQITGPRGPDCDEVPDASGSGLRPLATLGDYRLVHEIGRGGMGVVFEAQQLSLGRKVALKVLPFAAMLDKRQLARFHNEARAAATLNHPHIVPVYAVGEERGVHYYAMQLIEGQSLARVIEQMRAQVSDAPVSLAGAVSETGENDSVERPEEHTPSRSIDSTIRQAQMSTEREAGRVTFFRSVARLGIQIAEALDHAHEQGVLHRDVKPANIMLDDSGASWITDFGLARLEGDAGMTMTGDLLGTVRYMSPEQALAKRIVVDHRSDIYSLGVTLYEVLTLRPAFSGTDRQELLRKIAFEDPRLPRTIDRSIPVDLETIVMKAAAKRPEDRYTTAAALADDLQRYISHQPIHAKPPTVVDRALKWSRRHTTFVWSAAVVMLLTLVSLAVSNFFITQSLNSEQQQRRRAEDNLQMAKEAVDDWYVNFADDWLDDQAGLSKEQVGFLQKAADFYERVLSDEGGTIDFRFSRARALSRLAKMQLALNEPEAAEQSVDEAIEELERLVKEFPRDDQYELELAEAYLQKASGKPMEHERLKLINNAIEPLRKLAAASENTTILSTLASAIDEAGTWYHTRGEFEKADELFEEAMVAIETAVERDPENLDLAHQLGVILKDAAYALTLSPTEADSTQMRLGRREEGSQRYYRCLSIGRRLVKAAPANRRYRASLADNLMSAARFTTSEKSITLLKESVQEFEVICQQNPDRVDYQRRLADANRHLHHALMTLERHDEALAAIRKTVAIGDDLRPPGDDQSVRVRSQLMRDVETLGVALEKMERWEECRKATERLAQMARDWMAIDRTHQYLGPHELYDRLERACRGMGDEPAAKQAVLDRAKMIDEVIERITRNLDDGIGQNAFFLWQRGLLYHQIGRFDEAIADYTRIIAEMPQHQSAVMNRALLYGNRHQFDLYLEEVNRAVEAWPHSSICWGNRAVELLQRGRLDEAIEDLSKVLEIKGYDAEAYGMRAAAFRLLGRYQEAIADCETALANEPSPGAAFQARLQLIAILSHGPKNVCDPQRALDLVGQLDDRPEARAARASAYLAAGNVKQAREILEALFQDGDAKPVDVMMLSLASGQKEDWPQARQYYLEAIRLRKDHRPYAEIEMTPIRQKVEQQLPWAVLSHYSHRITGAATSANLFFVSGNPRRIELSILTLSGKVLSNSVNDATVQVELDGRALTPSKQYLVQWNATTAKLSLKPGVGRFADGLYRITLSSKDSPIRSDAALDMPTQEFLIKVDSALPEHRSQIIVASNEEPKVWRWEVVSPWKVIVPTGSAWKYQDDGTDQGTAWRGVDFDHAPWKQGKAQLGYGDGDESTVISYGPSYGNKFVTSYFRRSFVMDDVPAYAVARLDLLCDDGAAVYLNGTEIFRDNLAPDADFKTYTVRPCLLEDTFSAWRIAVTGLVKGKNVLAAEVHQHSRDSSDVSFDLSLSLLPCGFLEFRAAGKATSIPRGSKIYSARLSFVTPQTNAPLRLSSWQELTASGGNLRFQAPVSWDGNRVSFDVTDTVDNWRIDEAEDNGGHRRWMVWMDVAGDTSVETGDLTSNVEALSPRLVVEYASPRDQAQLAWYLAVFESGDEAILKHALSLAEHTAALEAGDSVSRHARGLALIRLGRLAEARAALSRADSAVSDEVTSHLLWGLLHQAEGNTSEAKDFVESTSNLARDSSDTSGESKYLRKELETLLRHND